MQSNVPKNQANFMLNYPKICISEYLELFELHVTGRDRPVTERPGRRDV